MGVGQSHAISGQRIEMWRVDLTAVAAVTLHVTDAEVIGKNEDDVRALGGGNQTGESEQATRKCKTGKE